MVDFYKADISRVVTINNERPSPLKPLVTPLIKNSLTVTETESYESISSLRQGQVTTREPASLNKKKPVASRVAHLFRNPFHVLAKVFAGGTSAKVSKEDNAPKLTSRKIEHLVITSLDESFELVGNQHLDYEGKSIKKREDQPSLTIEESEFIKQREKELTSTVGKDIFYETSTYSQDYLVTDPKQGSNQALDDSSLNAGKYSDEQQTVVQNNQIHQYVEVQVQAQVESEVEVAQVPAKPEVKKEVQVEVAQVPVNSEVQSEAQFELAQPPVNPEVKKETQVEVAQVPVNLEVQPEAQVEVVQAPAKLEVNEPWHENLSAFFTYIDQNITHSDSGAKHQLKANFAAYFFDLAYILKNFSSYKIKTAKDNTENPNEAQAGWIIKNPKLEGVFLLTHSSRLGGLDSATELKNNHLDPNSLELKTIKAQLDYAYFLGNVIVAVKTLEEKVVEFISLEDVNKTAARKEELLKELNSISSSLNSVKKGEDKKILDFALRALKFNLNKVKLA